MEFRESLSWRVFRDDSGAHYMYFDASREAPGVRELTEDEKSLTLDKQRSVSGLIRSDQLELLDGCTSASSESLEALPF